MAANIQTVNNIFGDGIRTATLSLSSAQILALNTTPIEIIPAFSGKYIQVISASAKYTYNTTTYVIATDLQLIADTATIEQCRFRVLTATASTFRAAEMTQLSVFAVGSTQILLNKKINVFSPSVNPTVGNGTLIIYAYYRLI